ncbi:uncharacterized protein LOC104421736 [Eucalyptus grandis]|uniref:uncharacterized protein LOC104421736 n=1 Tax=Eucalyptus grandis TaxID=71139 RepID=UPI00052496DB|nr:uncharacterized protein LOC104421736 [Eucalyptus grandis]
MLGLARAPRFRPPILRIPPPPLVTARRDLAFPSPPFKAPTSTRENPSRFAVSADNGNGGGDGRDQESEGVERPEKRSDGAAGDDGDGDGDLKGERRRRPPMFDLRLGDLLDRDPDNILAVGLTGLLTWASVQVLWQLCFVSVAILVAALKYSFIAALLIFILVTLL